MQDFYHQQYLQEVREIRALGQVPKLHRVSQGFNGFHQVLWGFIGFLFIGLGIWGLNMQSGEGFGRMLKYIECIYGVYKEGHLPSDLCLWWCLPCPVEPK